MDWPFPLYPAFVFGNKTYNDSHPQITDSPATAAFAVLCCLLLIVCVVGNALVVVSFVTCPLLKVLTNYWIVSLSMTDIILALLVLPLQINRELHEGQWTLGPAWCDIFITMDVLCCTCSIYHLCLISLDRNFCVQYPFTYMRWRTKNMTLGAIATTWILCALISVVRFMGLQDIQPTPYSCIMTNRVYALLSSFLSFYFPLAVIVCMYFAIWRKTQGRSQKFSSERTKNHSRAVRADKSTYWSEYQTDFRTEDGAHSYGRKSSRTASTNAPGFYSFVQRTSKSSNNNAIVQMMEHFVKSPSFAALVFHTRCSSPCVVKNMNAADDINDISPLNASSVVAEAADVAAAAVVTFADFDSSMAAERTTAAANKPHLPKSESLFEIDQMRQLLTNQNLGKNAAAHSCVATDKDIRGQRLSRRLQRQEKRAAKVVLLVLMAFVFLWSPFFFVNVLNAVFPVDANVISRATWTVVTWMGYCNSAVNPFIYTCFNKTFRRAMYHVCRASVRNVWLFLLRIRQFLADEVGS